MDFLLFVILLIMIIIVIYLILNRRIQDIADEQKDAFKKKGASPINFKAKDYLTEYWYCENDNLRMQVFQEPRQSPNFSVTKEKMDINLNNAVAMKKIPQKSQEKVKLSAEFIFQNLDIDEIFFISVKCKECGNHRAAPEIEKMKDLTLKYDK